MASKGASHIYTTRQMMEKFYEHVKELHLIFVEFGRAYDGVVKSQLWEALRDFGIPVELVRLVEHRDFSAVHRPGETSRRGDALSSMLFNPALERVTGDTDDGR